MSNEVKNEVEVAEQKLVDFVMEQFDQTIEEIDDMREGEKRNIVTLAEHIVERTKEVLEKEDGYFDLVALVQGFSQALQWHENSLMMVNMIEDVSTISKGKHFDIMALREKSKIKMED